MAEGKKAFIVYTDWLKYTDEMTNEQKGLWIDWCLKYCNDLEPQYPNDPMAKMLCIMCKDILKRDLKKYENKVISIQNAREKRKNNIEINNDTNNEINNDINIGTSGVNSNKLIVNSNKLIIDDLSSSNIEEEKQQKDMLKQFFNELQELFNGRISNENIELAQDIYRDYGYKTALFEIKKYMDKKNPIKYTHKVLYNPVIEIKKEEEDKGSAWLDSFNKQWEGK